MSDSEFSVEEKIEALDQRLRRLEQKVFLEKEPEDELFQKAKEIVQAENQASTSLLQSKLDIGYARSARLLDQLERDGIISPASGDELRKVLKRN